MMKRKEIKNVLKFLGVLCIFALGYMTIVGTGKDDLLPSETEGVELVSVTVDSDTSSPLDTLGDCWFTSLETEVGDSLSDVQINLNGAWATFVPTRVNGGSGVTCEVTIAGVTVAQVYHSGTTPVTLTSGDFITLAPINMVLDNPGTDYNFCGACTGDVGTDYTVNIFSGVTATWTLNL